MTQTLRPVTIRIASLFSILEMVTCLLMSYAKAGFPCLAGPGIVPPGNHPFHRGFFPSPNEKEHCQDMNLAFPMTAL